MDNYYFIFFFYISLLHLEIYLQLSLEIPFSPTKIVRWTRNEYELENL